MSFPGLHLGGFLCGGPALPAWPRAWPQSAGPRSVPAVPARRGITAPLRRRPGGTRHARQRSAIPDAARKGCHHRGLATWGITPLQSTRRAPSSPWSRHRPAGTVRDRPRVDVHAVHGPNARRRAREGRGRTTGQSWLPSVTRSAPRLQYAGSPSTRHAGGHCFTERCGSSSSGTRPNARRHTQTHPATLDIPRP